MPERTRNLNQILNLDLAVSVVLATKEMLDAILRKIHDSGLASLSEEERRFLREMSERKREDVDFDARYRRK